MCECVCVFMRVYAEGGKWDDYRRRCSVRKMVVWAESV